MRQVNKRITTDTLIIRNVCSLKSHELAIVKIKDKRLIKDQGQ